MGKSKELLRGLNVYGGYVCYEPVARDLKWSIAFRP